MLSADNTGTKLKKGMVISLKVKAGDVYCCYNSDLEKYTACQVTKLDGENDKNAVLLTIDWVGDAPMTEQWLDQIKPLYVDYFHWDRHMRLVNVDPYAPSCYSYVGNCKPLTDDSTNSYAGWDEGYTMYSQMMWERIPQEKRIAFKSASKSQKQAMLAGREISLSTSNIYDSTFDFGDCSELLVLPCLSNLHCERWHTGLYEYLESYPFITRLHLEGHGQNVLDFRKSHVHTLLVDLSDVEVLYLNDDIEELVILNQAPDNCNITAKDNGRTLAIEFDRAVKIYTSLPNLSQLHCMDIEEIDFADILRGYPQLNELRLWGRPGIIRNFALLSQFKNMQSFSTVDLFGFTADDIPKAEEMGKLYWFWMSSLPEDAAKAAKLLYKKRTSQGLDLRIQKGRKPEWLAQNLDNPFRSWDGQENISSAHAKKAASIYKKVRSEILLLLQVGNEDISQQVSQLVTEYTEVFNKMDKRTGFIETVERDDIYTALYSILQLLPHGRVDVDAMMELFDELRDF